MTELDSSVVIALLSEEDALNLPAKSAIAAAGRRGALVICGTVFVELSALASHALWTLDDVLKTAQIRVDWQVEEAIWREAGRASREWYARRRGGSPLPRRVAADFVIGAHALVRGADLLTFDKRTFRLAFPKLRVVTV